MRSNGRTSRGPGGPLAARTGPEWRGESQGFQRHFSPVNAISQTAYRQAADRFDCSYSQYDIQHREPENTGDATTILFKGFMAKMQGVPGPGSISTLFGRSCSGLQVYIS